MKKKIAIVGSGISAMTCAYYLRNDFEISIFEKNDYLGGHTHTHSIKEGSRDIKIDTGFIVFNLNTYKNLLNLFAELGVEKKKSEMSFAVYNQSNNLQFSGSGLSGVFAQKKNIFSPKFWKFLYEINKFFKEARKDFDKVKGSKESIADYCKRKGLSDFFIDNYLAPMSSSVWSTPQTDVYSFPISLLLPFFENHGLLGATRHLQWYVVRGGSDTYIQKIVAEGDFDIKLSEKVIAAEENNSGVELKTDKSEYSFDYVVLASHSDESLAITRGLDKKKKDLLALFGYNKNLAVLHTDESIMPTNKKTWSAWNHLTRKKGNLVESSTVYWVNKLQGQKTDKNYFVSINPFSKIDESRIIKKIEYYHPNFTVENFAAQDYLDELNQDTKIFFAGAYFGYGFHEDGIKSGLKAVEALKSKK